MKKLMIASLVLLLGLGTVANAVSNVRKEHKEFYKYLDNAYTKLEIFEQATCDDPKLSDKGHDVAISIVEVARHINRNDETEKQLGLALSIVAQVYLDDNRESCGYATPQHYVESINLDQTVYDIHQISRR